MPANRHWKVDDGSLQPGPDEASCLEVLEERGCDQAHRWAHKADGDLAPDQDDQQDWRFRCNQPLSQVNDRLFKDEHLQDDCNRPHDHHFAEGVQ